MEVEGNEEDEMRVEKPKTRRILAPKMLHHTNGRLPKAEVAPVTPFVMMMHPSNGRVRKERIHAPSTFEELCAMRVENPLLYADFLQQKREDEEGEMTMDNGFSL